MKKSVLAAVLAASLFLSGCSGVSQEDYNSLLEENARLQEENISLKDQNTSSEISSNDSEADQSNEGSEDQDDEYRMPKNNVKRVVKALSLNYGTANTHYTDLSISQYNLEAECLSAGHNNQIKLIINLNTDNSLQELAAFCCFYLRLNIGNYIEENIVNNCENVVVVVNDINGDPIVVWLVYNDKGDIIHDMNYVNTDVLKALDEVILDSGKWKYVPIEHENIVITETPVTQATSPSTQSSPSTQTPKPVESQTPPAQATTTTGEINALKTAQSYLKYSAFSRNGLIGQLEYEGYTNSEAVYGADNVGADWNEQALKKAHSYLNYSAFSYKGLIEQLEYEEFTHEQAVYGVDNCGADWNEQAAKKAKQYLDYSSFSKDRLIDQLEYEGFTHEQAVYGATANGY